jgi:hypothetical protein
MKKLRGCLGVFAIFFFGVIFGVVIATGVIRDEVRNVVEGGPDKVVEVVVKRLKNDLQLDKNQQEMLQQIALETRIKLAAIRQQTQPQVAQTLDEAAQTVRGILNPNQIKKFDEIVAKARANWNIEKEVNPAPASTPPAASATPAPAAAPAAPAPEPAEKPAP